MVNSLCNGGCMFHEKMIELIIEWQGRGGGLETAAVNKLGQKPLSVAKYTALA
jgi:hypothetical protein